MTLQTIISTSRVFQNLFPTTNLLIKVTVHKMIYVTAILPASWDTMIDYMTFVYNQWVRKVMTLMQGHTIKFTVH